MSQRPAPLPLAGGAGGGVSWKWSHTLLALLLLACGGSQSPAERSPEDPIDALEATLLELDEPRRANVHIRAEGAVDATMSGALVIGPGNRARLRFDGHFAGEPKSPWLGIDAERMRGGSTADVAAFDVPTPPGAMDASGSCAWG